MCDTMVSITSDGVLFAKNSDRDANEAQILEWHPARDHDAGTEVRCTYRSIPQVRHTHAIVISRPWWMFGAEMGANEHGLVIGNEAVFTNQPDGPPSLLGMDLLRLTLERARNVSEASQVLIELLTTYGQGGACSKDRANFTYHNSFLLADREVAAVIETAGTRWASELVTSGARSISNGLTIPEFAVHYARAAKGEVVSCQRRRERTEWASLRAEGPLDFMAALRDHGTGAGPHWSPLYGSMAAPCVHAGGVVASSQTTSSMVADLRPGGMLWMTGTSAPCTSIFKPIRVNEPVAVGESIDDHFDSQSLWWRHELLHRAMSKNFDTNIALIANERDAVEEKWVQSPPDSMKAFADAELLERQWNIAVGTNSRDVRPSYVRTKWHALDERAGITGL